MSLKHSNPSREKAKPTRDAVGNFVEHPVIIEHREDKIVWRLKAELAEQRLDGSLQMQGPLLELYTDSGERIPIQGEQAWFSPIKKQAKFEGDVMVLYRDWELHCGELQYDGKADALHIPGSFRFTGPGISGEGHRLRASRRTEQIWVDEGVRIRDERPGRWEDSNVP